MGKSFAEYRKEAEKAATQESLVQQFFTFKNDGDMLSGAFLYEETVTIADDKPPCQRYVFATEDGLQSCLLGGAADKQISGKLKKGDLVVIVYHGKIAIRGGQQQVNKFDVNRWGHMSEADLRAFTNEDIPF